MGEVAALAPDENYGTCTRIHLAAGFDIGDHVISMAALADHALETEAVVLHSGCRTTTATGLVRGIGQAATAREVGRKAGAVLGIMNRQHVDSRRLQARIPVCVTCRTGEPP